MIKACNYGFFLPPKTCRPTLWSQMKSALQNKTKQIYSFLINHLQQRSQTIPEKKLSLYRRFWTRQLQIPPSTVFPAFLCLALLFFHSLNNIFHCFLAGPHTYTQVHTKQKTTQTVLTVAAGKPVHQTIPWAAQWSCCRTAPCTGQSQQQHSGYTVFFAYRLGLMSAKAATHWSKHISSFLIQCATLVMKAYCILFIY